MSDVAALRNSAPIEIEPLTKRLGARVHGIDCRDVDDAVWAAIEHAFHTHHVLVFPDQDLTPDQHAAFMERFGELDIHPQELSARTTLPLPENPKVELMLNKPGNYGPRAAAWHTDVTFREEPVAVTSLYGVETPAACADTIWTSMRAVFDDLTEGLKTTLRGLNAVHATAFVMGDKGKAGQDSYDPTKETNPKKRTCRRSIARKSSIRSFTVMRRDTKRCTSIPPSSTGSRGGARRKARRCWAGSTSARPWRNTPIATAGRRATWSPGTIAAPCISG